MKSDIYVLIEHLQGQIADISYVMLGAAHSIAEKTGADVIAVLLGYENQKLADNLAAERVLFYEHPDLKDFSSSAYRKVISNLLQEAKPRLMLFGDTSIGVEVACPLSVRLNLPLISSCRSVIEQDGVLKFTSQICGGKIMVEGLIPDPTALITMVPGAYKVEQGQSDRPPVIVRSDPPAFDELPVKFIKYFEPESGDIDISKEEILVSVGRGIQNQDNIELAQELADELGGKLCASRPVVDQDWLPTTRLVGKSGKRVKPRLYLALGISGAPEHTEAISDSETIVAVNTDSNAPIFNIAKFGTTIDLFNLVPALTESIRQYRASGNT
jgi:electron transfer flavoprotein alpha subunit